MLGFDARHGAYIGLPLLVSINVPKHDDFSVRTLVAYDLRDLVHIRRTPSGVREMSRAFEFGDEIACLQASFDDGCMAIGE